MNWKSLIALSLLALPGLFAEEYKIDGSHSKAGFRRQAPDGEHRAW